MQHQPRLDFCGGAEIVEGARHGRQPDVAGFAVDLHMRMHSANVGMAVPLDIVPGPAQETAKAAEQLEAGMGDAVALKMQVEEWASLRQRLDKLVEVFDQLGNTDLPADLVEQ